jgi:hypothetical protein
VQFWSRVGLVAGSIWVVSAAAPAATAQDAGRDFALSESDSTILARDVGDPVFAFMLGVIDADREASISGAELDSLATAHGGTKLPVRLIRRMSRRRVGEEGAEVELQFVAPVKTPIPYSILGYNPGSIRATRWLGLQQYELGDQTLRFAEDGSDAEPRRLEDLELFVIREGRMQMDIDGWLDKLMRGKLDDVELSGFLIFREGNRRVGLGFGYSPSHKGRTGAFDFTANKSIFPAPKAYLALGRRARALGERLLFEPDASRTLGPLPSR